VIGVLMLAAMLTLTFMAANKTVHRFDDHLTFNKKDKIPYGTYVAFQSLDYLFPAVNRSVNIQSPGDWDSAYVVKKRQALLIISPQFLASKDEMNSLISFAQHGNDVFISTRVLSYQAQDMLHCRTSNTEADLFAGDDDSLTVSLNQPPFAGVNAFVYPGRKFNSYFYKYDTAVTSELGRNEDGSTNFIQLKTGDGNIYLHLAPLTFSNYFLLHKNNLAYYAKVLSLIPPGTKNLIWDEYYLRKLFNRAFNDDSRGWLSVLFRYPAFKWGLLTAIITLLVFVLLEMRRKQRFIPVVQTPRNDSLDFVKTVGRLYYDKQDHKDLAKKMSLYFLEHIRTTYKLATGNLDEAFIKAVQLKSGCDEVRLRSIISFINFLHTAPALSDTQLAAFYHELDLFYHTTS
jgi:hypothetical protein